LIVATPCQDISEDSDINTINLVKPRPESYTDFATLDIPVTKEMQNCIACFETLAQIAILFIFSRSSPGFTRCVFTP
jgi:hypothetical protein